jgi:predicted nucleic acid-binding protein
MDNLNLMIAAQPLAADVVLVTSDRDLRRVRGLRSANWSKSF